jgi:hypothetical protein
MLMVCVLMRSMVSNVHRVMVHLRPRHCDRTLTARTCGRAQHGSRDRTSNGEQDGKQYQQPDTKGVHGEVRVARRAQPPFLAGMFSRSANSYSEGCHSGKVKPGIRPVLLGGTQASAWVAQRPVLAPEGT